MLDCEYICDINSNKHLSQLQFPGLCACSTLAAGEIEHTRYDSYLRPYEKAEQINLWELKK